LPETAVRATNRDAALAERARREGDNSAGSKKLSEDEMRDAAEELQGYMESVRRDLRFNIDDDAGRLVIKVVDQKNGEVVRQIPSEEVLALLRRMKEADGDDRRGMLIKDEA
jgi:flagellar protein FlaG